MYYLIVLFIVILDQIVKQLVRVTMHLGESIAVVENLFHITYIQNTGGAFSILEGHMMILILLPAIFTTAILIYIYKKRNTEHWMLLLSLSLIGGGGIGNVTDRVRLGFVVDYLDFRVFPVFNIADICVCVGCGLLLLFILFPRKFEKRKGAVR